MDIMFLAEPDGFLRPNRRLHLADMSTAQEKHTDSGLSDSSADGIGKPLFNMPFGTAALPVPCIQQFQAEPLTPSRIYPIPIEESSRAVSSIG